MRMIESNYELNPPKMHFFELILNFGARQRARTRKNILKMETSIDLE